MSPILNFLGLSPPSQGKFKDFISELYPPHLNKKYIINTFKKTGITNLGILLNAVDDIFKYAS